MIEHSLIIGTGGFIGRSLACYQEGFGIGVTGTNRRGNAGRIKFELAVDPPAQLPAGPFDYAIVCAGKTSIQECETGPEHTRSINVTATFDVIQTLVQRHIFTVFLSSNAVFDGTEMNPGEDAKPNPKNQYGLQKYECEQLIGRDPACRAHVAIVRLTKVLSPQTPIVQQALDPALPPVRAFTDVNLSPISVDFVCDGITKICRSKTPGIFHLSGAADVTYDELLRKIVKARNLQNNRIIAHPSNHRAGADFRPTHSSLGMGLTSQKALAVPQSIESFLQALSPC